MAKSIAKQLSKRHKITYYVVELPCGNIDIVRKIDASKYKIIWPTK